MLAIILQIAIVVIALGGIAYFITTYWQYIANAWDWCVGVVSALADLCPTWIAPFIGVLLVLALVGIIIKVV